MVVFQLSPPFGLAVPLPFALRERPKKTSSSPLGLEDAIVLALLYSEASGKRRCSPNLTGAVWKPLDCAPLYLSQ
jgi:hypothetical protein